MSEGSLWLEPELRRIDALVAAELAPGDTGRAESMLRSSVQRARELRFPVFERRCLASLAQFLESSGRPDPAVESRLAELASLGDLDRRVSAAMQALAPA